MWRETYSKFQIKFIFSSKLNIIPALFYHMFIAFNFFVPAMLGSVFLCCKVFEIFKVGSITLLAELSFRHAFYLVLVFPVADIRVAWFIYLRTYCVPTATLNQNKWSRLLYLGDAQLKRCHTRKVDTSYDTLF